MAYQFQIKTVTGKNTKEIMIFSLSTCFWCEKTKTLLNNLGIEYNYVNLDLLEGKEQEEAQKEMIKYNPNGSFPTLVVNNGEKIIIGFQESEIEDLKNGS